MKNNNSFFFCSAFLCCISCYQLLILNNCNLPCSCSMWVTGDFCVAVKFTFQKRMCFLYYSISFSSVCSVCVSLYFLSFSVFCIHICIYILYMHIYNLLYTNYIYIYITTKLKENSFFYNYIIFLLSSKLSDLDPWSQNNVILTNQLAFILSIIS